MTGGEPASVELRRVYHDRIAELKERAQVVVDCAMKCTETVTHALLDQDRSAGEALEANPMSSVVAEIDTEAVDLLALQSPVARDLRLILASRDVAQTALLCVGLCRAVDGRVGSAADVLTPDLAGQLEAVGGATSDLLRRAGAAWATLEPSEAVEVITGAEDARLLHLDLLASLIAVQQAPVEVAVKLGLAARAFERLTDHAVEIAERVLFVAGQPNRPDT